MFPLPMICGEELRGVPLLCSPYHQRLLLPRRVDWSEWSGLSGRPTRAALLEGAGG